MAKTSNQASVAVKVAGDSLLRGTKAAKATGVSIASGGVYWKRGKNHIFL